MGLGVRAPNPVGLSQHGRLPHVENLPQDDARPEPPDEEWCPAHDSWFGPDTECPGCRDEWEQTWTLGDDPAEIARRDDWADSRDEWPTRAEIDHHEATEADGWYRDLVSRAEYPGFDPHSPERGL